MLPAPRNERCVVELDDGMTKRSPHRRAQRLRVHRIGAAAQQQARRRPERVRRANQRPDVARILHAVHNQKRTVGHVVERPRARLHDREDALRRLGARELRERARPDLFDRDGVTRQLGGERLAARGARELGSDERALELETGRERLLDQAHAFDHRQAAAAPRLAPLEIAHGRLQITGDACSRTGHGCP